MELLGGDLDDRGKTANRGTQLVISVLQSQINPNTVRQVITTVSAKVFFKGGRPRCSGRFSWCVGSVVRGVRGAWGQTEFQVNLKLGLTPLAEARALQQARPVDQPNL